MSLYRIITTKELNTLKIGGKFDLREEKNQTYKQHLADLLPVISLVPIDPGLFRHIPTGQLIRKFLREEGRLA